MIEFQYSRVLETQYRKNTRQLRYIVLFDNLEIACFFCCRDNEDKKYGLYEYYLANQNTPKLSVEFPKVLDMKDPQNYHNYGVIYLDVKTKKFVGLNLKYGSEYNIFKMPSKQFKTILGEYYQTEYQEDFYVNNCLSFRIFKKLQIVFMEKQFIYEELTANNTYFGCIDISKSCLIGELFLQNKFYIFDQAGNYIFICQQDYIDETFQFYLWEPNGKFFRFINIGSMLNAKILNLFFVNIHYNDDQIYRQDTIKQDSEILIAAQVFENQSLCIISLQLDEEMILKKKTTSIYYLNQIQDNIIQIPWSVNKELIVQYQTSQSQVLTKINRESNEIQNLFTFQLSDREGKFYFSDSPQQFVLLTNRSQNTTSKTLTSNQLRREFTLIYQFSMIPLQIHYLHYIIQKGFQNLLKADLKFILREIFSIRLSVDLYDV